MQCKCSFSHYKLIPWRGGHTMCVHFSHHSSFRKQQMSLILSYLCLTPSSVGLCRLHGHRAYLLYTIAGQYRWVFFLAQHNVRWFVGICPCVLWRTQIHKFHDEWQILIDIAVERHTQYNIVLWITWSMECIKLESIECRQDEVWQWGVVVI